MKTPGSPPISPSTTGRQPTGADSLERLLAALFGLFLGIGLLKWGNPVILDRLVDWPRDFDEWRVFAWPVRIGHAGLLLLAVLGVAVIGRRWRPVAPTWLVGSLLFWLGWQCIASCGTRDAELTPVILVHFLGCLTCFTLGHLALGRVSEPRVFWICLMLGFAGVLSMASDQHFGGLEATRKMILESPEAARLGPEQLARIRSNRVFSTLVYPNALAGAVLLLLPVAAALGAAWGGGRGRAWAYGVGGLILILGLAVLVWSGSKAGWLLALGMAVFVLFHAPFPVRWKLLVAGALVAGGLLGFRVVFAEKLRQGATSVSARFDYWEAAVNGVRQSPWFGHGPGSFKKLYASVKRPESEMAQLAHNDYLQQAVDSGLPGGVAYAIAIWGGLGFLYRRRRDLDGALPRAVWLGLAAWFAHGFVEFGLYIPATAWVAWALFGWLLAQKPSAPPTD